MDKKMEKVPWNEGSNSAINAFNNVSIAFFQSIWFLVSILKNSLIPTTSLARYFSILKELKSYLRNIKSKNRLKKINHNVNSFTYLKTPKK
jgi:hypothetical protein